MVIELKSLFQGQQSILALKAVAFGIGVRCLEAFGISPLSLVVFIVFASFLYFRPFAQSARYLASFVALVLIALLMSVVFASSSAFNLIAISLGLLAYLLFGLKDLYFIQRETIHYLLTLALFYGSFLLFFAYDKSSFFFLLCVLLFALHAILWFGLFQARQSNEFSRGRSALFAGVFAFIGVQAGWAISLLPLSFLNEANLGVLILFSTSNFSLMGGGNGKSFTLNALKQATLFIALAILIFSTSNWSL
jgi:hypothetical protein